MKTESFTNYMSRVIENLKKEERYGTAYIYSYALKALRIYKGKNDLPFSVFNKMEMKHFEQYLLNNKRSWNTIPLISALCVPFIIGQWTKKS